MFRRSVYQYYTNVNYKSCEQCLAWHGAIRSSRDDFPQPTDGCESAILEIPARKLRAYRRQAKLMKSRAQSELVRRALFAEAVSALATDPDSALEVLKRASDIDLYIPDIAFLAKTHAEFLTAHPDVRHRVRLQLRKSYSDKFGWRRYERLPEMMRLQREQAGLQQIDEILG